MGNNVPQILVPNKNAKSMNLAHIYQKNNLKLSKIPDLKASFSYMTPLSYECEQTPQQQNETMHVYSIKQQTQKSHVFSSNSLLQSQTFVNFSIVQQIKVKWNSFIKMKTKNYQQDYQFIKKIGKGGFGVVNKVKNKYTKVIRAAKIIQKKNLKEGQHKKLLQQLNIMKQLDHPNIIKLYQIYDFQQQYVLILQLSEGGQLYQRIKTKKLSQDTIRNFMTQIIKTLIYLHSQKKIIHRDLKPENMLFQFKGSDTIKLIDFGLATVLPQNQGLTSNNQQIYLKDRVGTPSYIAPQVIYRKYNQKCDIWSAGVIFYFMISGVMPFRGQNQNQLIQNILRGQPSFQSSVWNKFSTQCKQLIKLMLQKKLQLRPSASQVFEHKWFQIKQQSNKKQILSQQKGLQILQNIRSFSFRNKLQAVINTFIACQLLSGQSKQILKQLFFQIDLDHNGVISTQQLKIALSKVKQISYERVQYLKNIIDTNGNGQIEYTQFLVASIHHQDFMNKDYFQKAFAYFDIDHDGTITYQEVVSFLGNQQEEQPQIRKMFQEIDVNGNGQIDLEQFIRLFIQDTAQLMKFFPCKFTQKQLKDHILQDQSLNRSQMNRSTNISQMNRSGYSDLNKSKNIANQQHKYMISSNVKPIQILQSKNSNINRSSNIINLTNSTNILQNKNKRSSQMFQNSMNKRNSYVVQNINNKK